MNGLYSASPTARVAATIAVTLSLTVVLLSATTHCAVAQSRHRIEQPNAPAQPPPPPQAGTNDEDDDWDMFTLLMSMGVGAPYGLWGGALQIEPEPGYGIEFGAGLGGTGLQIALLGRWYPFDDLTHRFSLAGGPSMALRSEASVPRQGRKDLLAASPEIVYVAYMSVEVAYDWRTQIGFTLRAALGGAVNFSENQSHLCDGIDPNPDVSAAFPHVGCQPLHFPNSPEIASVPAFPYLRFDIGWAF